MIAPPGRPKMVVVPCSTSDRQIARAPVMRIYPSFVSLQQKTPPPVQRRGRRRSRGTTLLPRPSCLVHWVLACLAGYRPPPRPGLLASGVFVRAARGRVRDRSWRRLSAAAGFSGAEEGGSV